MERSKIFKMAFSYFYPFYIQKAEKKGKTKDNVNTIIYWLTGYNEVQLKHHLKADTDIETFFNQAPQINPNVSKIKGLICGCRVEDIKDTLWQKVRYLDKLIDELARGKKMENILRS